MKIFTVLVSTVLFALVFADHHNCNNSMTANGYTVWWVTEPDSSSVQFTVSVENSASQFIAVGFSDDQIMPDTDVAVGSTDGAGNDFVEDRYAYAYIIPRYDTIQSLRSTSISLIDGTMQMSFIRDIVSDDSRDDLSLNKCVYILSSWGGVVSDFTSPADFSKHTMTNVFGDTQLCLNECTSGSTVLMVSALTLILSLFVGLLF